MMTAIPLGERILVWDNFLLAFSKTSSFWSYSLSGMDFMELDSSK